MDENYIRQGYIVCKAIGDAVNSKEVTIPETKSLDDFENRVRFIERHNLATLYSYAADKKDFGAYTGYKKYKGETIKFYDLPGTYSLIPHSEEEKVTSDFVISKDYDIALVVCDPLCLERNLNLVIQTLEVTKNVIMCINLLM